MKLSSIINLYSKQIIKLHYKKFSQQGPAIKYKFNVGVVKIPHYTKKEKGGEDAYAATDCMICVADGVGGWNEMGVDPSKYSRELCLNVEKEYKKSFHKYFGNPKRIFAEAAALTKSMGSSTFCMCSLDLEKNYLHTVNLGDSGYMIVRDSRQGAPDSPNPALNKVLETQNNLDLVYKSEEQQHQFNFPFQCGTNGDNPEEAITNTHEFKEGDIVIVATDGLWDNLYENQIISIMKPFFTTTQSPDLTIVAEMIGESCVKYSMDSRYMSPFSKRSRGLYRGGKDDDITIIVAQIVKNI
jgi:protein phosphatase PTC7